MCRGNGGFVGGVAWRGLSKRGAEEFLIAFVGLIGDEGVTIGGHKAQWSLGYHASQDIEKLRVDRRVVKWQPVAVPRRRWRLGASPARAIPKPSATRSGERFV